MNRLRNGDLSRRAVAVFFIALFLVGMLADYAGGIDEVSEIRILYSNACEYALRIFGEDSALYGKLSAVIEPISQYAERDHGISAYYPALPALAALRIVSGQAQHAGWIAWTFLLFMLGVVALYGIARELLRASRLFGCAAALMLYLSPRMFASGHYNNKDAVLLALILLTVWLGVRFYHRNRLRDALLFSVAGAFAANTKIIGAWFWGVFGLLYLFKHIRCKTLTAQTWRNGFAAIGAFLAVYLLLTPATWVDPMGFFKYVFGNSVNFSRWSGSILFEGRVYRVPKVDQLPWYYLPKLMLMTTPVLMLVLAAAGLLRLIAQSARGRGALEGEGGAVPALWAALIAYAVPLLIGMFGSVNVYNSWRHFYFEYAALMLLSIYALDGLFRWLSGRARRVAAGMLAAYFCFLAASLAINHPMQDSYFNPIAAPFVEGNYETDYWVMSAPEVLERLVENPQRNAEFELSCYSGTKNRMLMGAQGLRGYPGVFIAEKMVEANYYVRFMMDDELMCRIYEDFEPEDGSYIAWVHENYLPWKDELDNRFHELFRVTAYGYEIATVYERNY